MPKHTRSSSSNQARYSNPVPVSLAPSAMPLTYSSRPTALPLNTSMGTGYYGLPTQGTSAGPVPMSAQSYESYTTSVAAPVPPAPPMPHRASSGAWSHQDDQNLLTARQQGLNWAQIQSTYFPNKSPNACRKRHERLLERRGVDDWDARKLERLAKDYMSMRKEIWQGLAARTGEKWLVVEQKCMHNGLKNLQSAARSAARRERMEQGHPMNGYDDDSGISGIVLTPVDDPDASYSSPETASSVHSHHSGGSGGYGMQQHHHHQQQQHHQHHPMTIPYGPGPHQQHHHHQQQHAHAAAAAAAAAGYGSSYGSSISSTAAAHGYTMHPHSQDGSPYMTNGQRLPSADMGIEAIINRPGHGRGPAPNI